MDNVDDLTRGLERTSLTDEQRPTEVPFHPSGDTDKKFGEVPRFLFRVFSRNTAGENNNEWMKSVDALNGNLTNIFDRNEAVVAITLNEHLRWLWVRDFRDPFISWTTSLLFAIQYAIYKQNKEGVSLDKINLCVVDTTLFPTGTFIQDLKLMEEFQEKVQDDDRKVIINGETKKWKSGGLDNLRNFRSSGPYYFGEYLAQGQIYIKDRSHVISCDNIVNEHLYTLVPGFETTTHSNWAKAVLKLREPFYTSDDIEKIGWDEIRAAHEISKAFEGRWFLMMFASLLGLRPRPDRDPLITRSLSKLSGIGIPLARIAFSDRL